MRPLKFRAWDGKELRYDVTGFEHGDGNEMEGVLLNGDYYCMSDAAEKRHGDLHNRAVVMQFTGLLDSQGVEIYEGDIVQRNNNLQCIAPVIFSTDNIGSCGCCMTSFHGSGFAAFLFDSYGDTCDSVDLGERCKVIGNIHQNPELLK